MTFFRVCLVNFIFTPEGTLSSVSKGLKRRDRGPVLEPEVPGTQFRETLRPEMALGVRAITSVRSPGAHGRSLDTACDLFHERFVVDFRTAARDDNAPSRLKRLFAVVHAERGIIIPSAISARMLSGEVWK